MSTGVTTSNLVVFLLVLLRVGAWVWITPPFGGKMLPPLVRDRVIGSGGCAMCIVMIAMSLSFE